MGSIDDKISQNSGRVWKPFRLMRSIRPPVSRTSQFFLNLNWLSSLASCGRTVDFDATPYVFLNSAKIKHSRHTNFFCKKRVLQNPSDFWRSFFTGNLTGILMKTGWKLSPRPYECITSKSPPIECKLIKIFQDFTKCANTFGTYFSILLMSVAPSSK